MATYNYPIAVIGAGAGGLVVAIGAAKAGKKVLLIEQGNWGGDCTNTGCIPSKSLIASAHHAHALRRAESYGLKLEAKLRSADGTLNRLQRIVNHFVDEEDPSALAKHSVDTLTGKASFVDAHTLRVEGKSNETVTADQIVIATGSHPVVPPITGLDQVPYLTNETLFSLEKIPSSLAIIGGGAIGCEMAQALQRLGSQVILVEFFDHLLPREEPEAQAAIEKELSEEGITLHLGHSAEAVEKENGALGIRLKDRATGTEEMVRAESLLLSVGRAANTNSLNLAAINVETTNRNIPVDRYGRTSCRNVWAVGDCNGGPQFTHWAEAEGRAVLTSLLLPGPLKSAFPTQAVPAVTYSDPEVARVGLTEKEAVAKYGEHKLATYHVPFSLVDRAVAAGREEGFVKVITKKWSSRILGATIVGERAGEMLPEIGLAMQEKIPLRKLARLIHPYPTYNHGIRKAADLWLGQTILPALKKLIGK